MPKLGGERRFWAAKTTWHTTSFFLFYFSFSRMRNKLPILLVFYLAVGCATAYKTIIDVLSEDKDGRFSQLITHLQRNRLVPRINKLEAATMFAPTDEAFSQLANDTKITQERLLYHLLPVGMTGQDFFHGQLVESLYVRPGLLGKEDTGQRIKVTKDGKRGKGRGKAYINGADIVDSDVVVNNQTYIQVINKVLEPPRMLGEILKQHPNLYAFMQRVGLADELDQPRPFTVFIPRQEHTFDKLNPIEQTYLNSSFGQDDLSSILKYTVLEGPLYKSAFPAGTSTHETLSGESISTAVDKNDVLIVNGVPAANTDILAANGVIHELDDFYYPGSLEFNARKYLYGLNATKYVSLLDEQGLGYYMDDDKHNYTFLCPGNEDIDEDEIPYNERQDWLSYHLLEGAWHSDDMQDGLLLETEFASPQLGGARQRVPVFVQAESALSAHDSQALAAMGQSIRFAHSRVLDAVSVKNSVIYQLSEPLTLPGDMLSRLVVDLDLSTFIATLYVSEVADEIKASDGVTIFVPSNDAFQNLGLVAKYLMHQAGKAHLQSVLRYHVAKGLLYRETMQKGAHEVETLAGTTLRTSTNDQGEISVGHPVKVDENGKLVSEAMDILVDNGVVHKTDTVLIPDQVQISNEHLLRGIEANSMLEVLSKSGLLDGLNQTEVLVLAPTEKAFAHMDLEALLEDPYQLERVAKLHLVPAAWQQWSKGTKYPTFLSDKDTVEIKQEKNGAWVVKVKDQDEANGGLGHILGMGRASAGAGGGGVLQIDTVLMPVHRGLFGLPFGWSVALITGISVILASMVGVCGFFAYKIYTRRRLGYQSIE
ncbi:FAS1 domain-containing protein [Syncephalastrum racemosum]|uniref:FAS1 domain-containing protein n=1 Tax=Syncephalastrum racemosum TaxID=13706 RepID=A0A1X2HTG6_SYNRA|nr:FAS1 domain-containing protein [Syncephalastrum racemosum]